MPKNTTIGIGQKSQYSISYISKVQTFFEKLLLDYLLLPTIAMENSIHFFGAFRKGNVTRLTRCAGLCMRMFGACAVLSLKRKQTRKQKLPRMMKKWQKCRKSLEIRMKRILKLTQARSIVDKYCYEDPIRARGQNFYFIWKRWREIKV